MKYVITKDQYGRVLLNYLESFITGFIVGRKKKGYKYVEVITSDGEEFANLWYGGPVTKGCKNELSLKDEFTAELENFIPINRKKVFSEVMLKFFYLKTGIKCDCIEYNYFTGKYEEFERYIEDSDEVFTFTEKKYDVYQYKRPKKR